MNLLNRKEVMSCKKPEKVNHFSPLLIATVGLPGRGKSLLARRLGKYLNFIGDKSKVFDITEYRRKYIKKYDSHHMFRADNLPAWEIRQKSFHEALEDAAIWLHDDGNLVAILDGPNVSRLQRQEIYNLIHDKYNFKIMFIECVCEDPKILENNLKDILKYSIDYKNITAERALNDLTLKMAHYKDQYDSLGKEYDPPCPIITVIDSGFSGVAAHGISGSLEAKILAYISIPKASKQTLYFSRHGESEFNVIGRIGGDTPLSPRGKKYSHILVQHIQKLKIPKLQIWTSTLQRTKATVEMIKAPKQHLHELDEIYSGECEGFTYEELLEKYPRELALRDMDKFKYRYPQGESYKDVITRVMPTLLQMETDDNILTVSHQAVLRCILGYFLETPLEEIPYLHVPLHTVIKLTMEGYSYSMESFKLPVDCVDTNRPKPNNCSSNRSSEEVLKTVPAHYESLSGLTSCN